MTKEGQEQRLMTNAEVYAFLKECKDQGPKSWGGTDFQNLATIQFEVLRHLNKTSCTLQTEQVLTNFVEAVEPFKLTKAETLMILNHRPKSLVELYLIIEEIDERFTEESRDELLELIQTLPDIDDQS
ncbi:hypothetical protein HDV05_004720 [Chytridiales sp. JEL 0842]|nr:hypothetical protein HDV05_004720 [Chytridiales sp. JEL 0842]